MNTPDSRPGRPRRYDIHPIMGFADPDAAYGAALLDELLERLADMIGDLSQEALDFVPPGTTNSIAMLVLHMAWAEASWIARATDADLPPELEQCLRPGRQDASGSLPPSSATGEQLIATCRAVREQVTQPGLAPVEDIDVEVGDERQPMTVRGVLMHLIWHWTYHSGQVGLLRRLWGASRYQWTFERHMGSPHTA